MEKEHVGSWIMAVWPTDDGGWLALIEAMYRIYGPNGLVGIMFVVSLVYFRARGRRNGL